MALFVALTVLVSIVILLGLAEHVIHNRRIAAIPIRIHVNGTRGKSSVVRLIAAALRAHGIKAFAKTTGTLPRFISDDGSELPIDRPGRTNIIEQLRIIGFAARAGAEAIVIECMALQPELQSLCELRLVRSTHGVVSNAWPDHLDVMGPGVEDVALALAGTTPVAGCLFTVEQEHQAVFEHACVDRGSELVVLGDDAIAEISDEDMARFGYIEHKENVALALAVVRSLGVPQDVALDGMVAARPDVGALRQVSINFFGRQITFMNGFAANDPVSTERIWSLTLEHNPEAAKRLMVINCRLDRPDRSLQLGEAIAGWAEADHYVLIGTGTFALARTAVLHGVSAARLVPLEGLSASEIFEELMSLCGCDAVVLGAGNIAGVGLDLVRVFENRTTPGVAA